MEENNNMNNNQIPQQPQQSEVNVQNNVSQPVNPGVNQTQTNTTPKKKGKGGIVFAIIAVILVVLIGAGAFLFSLRAKDPKTVYSTAIDLVKTQYHAGAEEILKEGYKKTIDVDFNVSTGSNATDDIAEYLNNARINIIYQKDNDFNAQVDVNVTDKQGDFANLKVNYNNDLKDIFVQLAQLNNKWIDLELDEDDVEELVEELQYSDKESSLSKEGADIILEEIRKAILEQDIKEDKEQIEYNGGTVTARKNYIVLDEDEFIKFVSDIADNLLDNDDFQQYINENSLVYTYLEELSNMEDYYNYGYDDDYDDDDDFDIYSSFNSYIKNEVEEASSTDAHMLTLKNEVEEASSTDAYMPTLKNEVKNTTRDIERLTPPERIEPDEDEKQGMEVEIDLYTTGFFSNKFAGASLIARNYEDNEETGKMQVDYRIEGKTESKITFITSDENIRGNTVRGTLYINNIDENHQNYKVEYNNGDAEKYEVNIKVVTSGDIDIANVSKRNAIKYDDITEADTANLQKSRLGQVVQSLFGTTGNTTPISNPDPNMKKIELYNMEFEAYTGDYMSAANTKALLEKIKTNNENYENSAADTSTPNQFHLIDVKYNNQVVGKEEFKDLIETKISSQNHYVIKIEYEADGYIKTVNINEAAK